MSNYYSDDLLTPVELPINCTQNGTTGPTLSNVKYLYENGIILWPNFTNCLPVCGLCTSFNGDRIYNIYNLFVIGLLLPFISFCGLIGNSISAFVYSQKCKKLLFLFFSLTV